MKNEIRDQVCELPKYVYETVPLVRRDCSALSSQKFHFDKEIGECVEFKYRGCFGTDNVFDSVKECRSICQPGTYEYLPSSFRCNDASPKVTSLQMSTMHEKIKGIFFRPSECRRSFDNKACCGNAGGDLSAPAPERYAGAAIVQSPQTQMDV